MSRVTQPAAEKILIVAPNWIGDALMAQPLLALLKRRHPNLQIDAIAPAWVAPALAAMPEVQNVIPTHLAHGALQWRERVAFAKQIRAQGYSAAYVLPNSFKSALIPWLAGIPLRVGYQGETRIGVLNVRHPNAPKNAKLPMVQHYAALAATPQGSLQKLAPDGLPNPQLQVSPEAIAAACEAFAIDPSRPLVAFCPGAEYGPAKRWPATHFADLAQQILKTFPYAQLIALGGPKDAEIAEAIRATAPQVRNLCGTTKLEQAIALLARTDAAVCNDSGLMHVTAALNRPLVAVFGSSDPRHTPPHSAVAQVIWLQLECSPCFERTCPLGHTRCLTEISAEQVFERLRLMLARSTA